MYGLGGILEICGGLLLALGLFTRPISFLLAGQMAYAYFFMHMTPETVLDPLSNKGEIAIMYCMAFLLFLVKGAGSLSLDAKLANK
jgi:doxX family protein, possible membrane protein